MAYTVTLDNGMTGYLSHTLYDFCVSSLIGGFCGLATYCSLKFNNKQKEPKTNIYDSKIPIYQYLEDYMNNLSENDKPSDLGERMKIYEDYTEYNIGDIDSQTGFIVRVDGRCFSNLLHQLKNQEIIELKTPFMSDFVKAMQLTTSDLLKEFNASTGYTHSDEISLYFKALNSPNDEEADMKEHIFGGRVQKLISLISSYASTRLIKHLSYINKTKFESILDRITFDGRVICFPSNFEVCNYFLWRSKQDCFRNFVSEICYMHFPKKSLNKLNVDERITKLRNEKHIDINDYNIFLRRGTFVKRELEHYEKDNVNYWRNLYVKFALPNLKCNDAYTELFECKNFEEWEFQDIEFELLGNC